jgi:serine/threonine protein kinase
MPPPPREAFHHRDANDPCSTANRPLALALSGLPALCSDEIHTGPELGQGGYCSVLAVRAVQLSPDAPTDKKLILTADAAAARGRFRRRFGGYREAHRPYHLHRPGQPPPPVGDPAQQKPPKLALKRLKSSLNRKRQATGLADLTSEVALLAQLGGHPNIVGCYGVGYDTSNNGGDDGDGGGGDDNEANSGNRSIAFVLLDQLRCTLRNKLYLWRERRGAGMLISRSRLHELWLERMVILMRIASAVEYLHSKGVAHRDINCDNVGFDCVQRSVQRSHNLFSTLARLLD